jgi:hypothetical protein
MVVRWALILISGNDGGKLVLPVVIVVGLVG